MYTIDAADGGETMYVIAVCWLTSLSVLCEAHIRSPLVTPLFREPG